MTRDQHYVFAFFLIALGAVMLMLWGMSGAWANGQTFAGMVLFFTGICQVSTARKKPHDE